MTIKRTINGEEISITLTEDEMRSAYREQWDAYCLMDVRCNIDCEELSERGIKDEDCRLVQNEIHANYVRAKENDDSWWDVLMTVTDDVCREWIKNHKEVEV